MKRLMLRLRSLWFAPVFITISTFGLGIPRAIGQTIYSFEETYDSQTTLQPLAPNTFQIDSTAQNPNAIYGLTNVTNRVYGALEGTTGELAFSSDPASFGLEGLPNGGVVFFGSGEDKLLGTNSGNGLLDFANLSAEVSGTITITGGEGRFAGATGTLTFIDIGTLGSTPTKPVRSLISLRGSFETVPEPESIVAPLSIGLIGASFLLRQRQPKVAA